MDLKATVECHCRLTSFSLSISVSSFPLKSSICHCHACRHTTGQLFTTWAVIPVPLPSEILDSHRLLKYEIGSHASCQRWSCRRCGASVFNIDEAEHEWEVATGLLHFADAKGLEGRLNRVQLWVEDVQVDGGTVGWINQGKLDGMGRHWRGRSSLIVSDESVKIFMAAGKALQDYSDRLLFECRCKGISFEAKRPKSEHPPDNGKFTACLDACTSCRTVTGFEVASWIDVPRDRFVVGGSLAEFLEDRTKLGHYESSSGTCRDFCLTCGATVFWYKLNTGTISVACGLLEPNVKGAVRAESCLDWEKAPKPVSDDQSVWSPEVVWFSEDAIDAQFVKGIAEGVRLWEQGS